MEALQLKAFTRNDTGKCPARRLRSTGMIPAILYGSRIESMKLAVNASELKRLLAQKADKKFFRLMIEADGKTLEKLSIVKQFDMHPMGKQIIHADFYEINMDQKISVDVPVHLKGIPVGIELGGELQQQKRMLRVSCLPALLPEGIDIDISRLNVGDSLKIKDLLLAEGISIQEAADVTVVFVAATRAAMKAIDEQAGVSDGQPEVLKQKAPEKKAAEKKK
jgi:large subunit ribosomal protein L25